MLLWALIVGLSFPAVGLLTEGLPPLQLTALRFAVAVIGLWPFLRGAEGLRPGLPGLLLYAGLGLCLATFFGAMFWAAERSTALAMATLYVSVPLLAHGMGRVLRTEEAAGGLPLILACGALGALGLAFAESGLGAGLPRFGAGEGVFFLGCLASALYPVLSKWGLARGWLSPSAVQRTFWSLLAGCLLMAAAGLLLEPTLALRAATMGDLVVLVYLGLFSSAVTFWLMQQATAALTPGPVTEYSYLVPFVSMLLLLAAEPHRLGWQWLPGSALVLLAIWALFRRSRSEPLPR